MDCNWKDTRLYFKGPSKETLSCHSTAVWKFEWRGLSHISLKLYATEKFGTSIAPIKMSVEDTLAFEIVNAFEKIRWLHPSETWVRDSSLVYRRNSQEKNSPSTKRVCYNASRVLHKSVEKRLLKDSTIAERYVTAIEIFVIDGYARLLATSELEGPKGRLWYLPHYYVINQNKSNKIRVVFDGRARNHDESRLTCVNEFWIIFCRSSCKNSMRNTLLVWATLFPIYDVHVFFVCKKRIKVEPCKKIITTKKMFTRIQNLTYKMSLQIFNWWIDFPSR